MNEVKDSVQETLEASAVAIEATEIDEPELPKLSEVEVTSTQVQNQENDSLQERVIASEQVAEEVVQDSLKRDEDDKGSIFTSILL